VAIQIDVLIKFANELDMGYKWFDIVTVTYGLLKTIASTAITVAMASIQLQMQQLE
jgi:hypothetical protein